MNYSNMKDFEINKAVAEKIYPGKEFTVAYSFGYPDGPHVQWIQGYGEFLLKDYCNSWADAGPIIGNENISLTCHQSRDEWAAIFNRHCMSANQNPLRAAMECFLMIKERENAA